MLKKCLKTPSSQGDWFQKMSLLIVSFYVVVGAIVRMVLAVVPPTNITYNFGNILKIWGFGVLNDVCFGILSLVLIFLYAFGYNDAKYRKPFGYIIELFLISAAIYVFAFHSVFDEYGGGAPKIAKILIGYKLVSFTLRFLFPKLRAGWRKTTSQIILSAYFFFILLNAVSEYFFWSEFGVRYNFIAVDYLVYTNEVIGNIFESYPVVPLFIILLILSAGVSFVVQRKVKLSLYAFHPASTFADKVVAYPLFFALGCVALTKTYYKVEDKNTYVTQLSQNGCFDFIEAFIHNKLDYDKFYKLLPKQECDVLYRQLCHQNAAGEQLVSYSQPPIKKNIVLITLESMSGDYLAAYGNKKNLTPNIDSLMQGSLVFDSLYAAGNRTVRGLEALTLCQPPGAGESIIKRPDNGNLYSTGAVLRKLGYTTRFFYGGDSYFDNMGTFFRGNGYQVYDKSLFKPSEISFQNIWGICDEDAYKKALALFDEDGKSGHPFFCHIMSISNHRPYTYPKGKIQIAGNPKSRDGGVKYSDYALGQFFKAASQRPWFKNTLFVVVADHCASSAGKTDLPIDRYHIPALIYAPGFVAPRRIRKVCSQIDLMPTVFALLKISYPSRFVGQDILSDKYDSRAFMATYQDLGFYKNGKLIVLSPVRRIQEFQVKQDGEGNHVETPVQPSDKTLIKEAQAYYQYTNNKKR